MKKLSTEQAFSLVEVLIAITIIGIVIFSFSMMFLNGRVAIIEAVNINNALRQARNLIEEGIITVSKVSDDIPFEIMDGSNTIITVSGAKLEGQQTYNARNHRQGTVTITYFKPLPAEENDEE